MNEWINIGFLANNSNLKLELVGIFGLGVKKSGDIYTTQDLNILELYAHQVGVAVENTKLYADLKLFNEKLQLEVEKATQDLRVNNKQLVLTKSLVYIN